MAKSNRETYADALKILGGDDPAVPKLTEALVEGGLGLVGVPEAISGRLAAKGRELLSGIGERITGVSRWDRTQRVEAAYRILLVTSLFEAMDEVLEESGPTPIELGLDDDEVRRLAELMLDDVGMFPPLRLTSRPIERRAEHGPFSRLVASQRPSSAWSLAQGDVAPVVRRIGESAHRRFTEHYRHLAADVPEFGVWVNAAEHQATRDELATGFAELERVLQRVSPRQRARQDARELGVLHRRALRRPVLAAADAPDDLALPLLEDAYIDPVGRVRPAHKGCEPSADGWWADADVHENLPLLIAGCLTRVDSASRPIVILGHPGAGKSKLTEMLAARLPEQDFLPLRVELRGVRADAPIRRQIEEGVSAQLHRDVQWRDLVETAEGAQPVVILDGFDELLQATGVNRSDYLEQVQQFQEDQAALGQPVAVIVTSRTVVADRVRFPLASTVIRLEPFGDDQIARMLDVWTAANGAALATRGLKPPRLETLLRYRELAEQPLLLLMLLLYDADDNALENAAAGFSRADLYEELLTGFARREVRKHRPNLDDREMRQAVEEELHRLEIAALAMFARNRQSVTAEELDRDLGVLLLDAAVRPSEAGLHGAVSDAHQVLGRFFFVHESRAQRDDSTASVFEFLHATFGEYLVARLVTATLDDLVADRQHAARRRFASELDDGLLYALTSFTVLAGRAAVLEFADSLLDQRFADRPADREDCRALLVELFRDAPFPPAHRSFGEYEPQRLPIMVRQGVYTANLATLLTLVADEEIPLTDLYPDAEEPWHEWRRLVGLWRSLPGSQWFGVMDAIRLRHLGYWENERPDVVLQRESGDPVNVGESVGFELRSSVTGPLSVTNPYEITVPYDSFTSKLLRSTALRRNGTAAAMMLMLLPYLRHVSTDVGTWFLDEDGETTWAEAHDVLHLRLVPVEQDEPEERVRRYTRLLHTTQLGRLELLVLRQAADDLPCIREVSASVAPLIEALASDYLRGLTSVVRGPAVSRSSTARILDELGFASEFGVPITDIRDHVLGLFATDEDSSDASTAPAREESAADDRSASRKQARRAEPSPDAGAWSSAAGNSGGSA